MKDREKIYGLYSLGLVRPDSCQECGKGPQVLVDGLGVECKCAFKVDVPKERNGEES